MSSVIHIFLLSAGAHQAAAEPVPLIVILPVAGRLSCTLVMTGSVLVVAVAGTIAQLHSATISVSAMIERRVRLILNSA